MSLQQDQIEVLSIAEGFFHSSILFALLKLKVFERIGDGTKTAQAIAEGLDAKTETVDRLLSAGVVIKLLEKNKNGEYRVSEACRSVLLPSAGENYLGNWIMNLDYFRDALSKLDEAVLRTGPTVDPMDHLGKDESHTREFTLAMHNYASLRGKELARFLDTSDVKTVLDLGCGPGTYAFNLGLANPKLEIFLLDLPEVLEVAKDVQKRYNITNKVHYIPLDAMKDNVPGTYDMVIVSNTLHMLGERQSRDLINRLYNSVANGGSLVIQAQYLPDDRVSRRWPVLLDLIQLCITTEGRNHAIGETKQWMEDAGFGEIEYQPMTLLNTNSYLRAYKQS